VFPDNPDVGLGITTQIDYHGTPLAICNFHGRSRPGDKLDTPERLSQSQGLIDCFRSLPLPLILGGDFNLDIHSTSISLLEKAGYKNLITEYAIRTTRNRIIWDKYPATPQLYSDYVFVSPDISVTDFIVPENEISDHLPLILRIA